MRLIHSRLHEAKLGVFPFYLNATELALFGTKGTGEAFPAMLLLELISSIWRELLRKPYSALVGAVEVQKRSIKIERHVETSLRRLFIQLRYPNYITSQEDKNEFSLSAFAKGGLSKTLRVERKSVGILPYEFMEYLEELKREVLPKVGIAKLVGIIDEANMMPLEWQEAVVSRHIDIFSNRGMQFILVAGFAPSFSAVDIPRNFEFILELKGLAVSDIPRFLEKHLLSQAKSFNESCIELLHSRTSGNPREIGRLAQYAVRRSIETGRPIDRELITSVVEEHKRMVEKLTLNQTRQKTPRQLARR